MGFWITHHRVTAKDSQLGAHRKFFFTMGLTKGSEANCKGCNRKHVRPWGKFCHELVKARTHAEYMGDKPEDYKQYLYLELPTGCTVNYPLTEGDGGEDNDMDEDKPGKQNVGGTLQVAGAGVASALEQDQAQKIVALELELTKLRDSMSHVGLASPAPPPMPMVVPTLAIAPTILPGATPPGNPPGLGLPLATGGQVLPTTTSSPASVYSQPVYTCASTWSVPATSFSLPGPMTGGGVSSVPPWAAGQSSTFVTGKTPSTTGVSSPYVVSAAAVFAASSLPTPSSSMMQPMPGGFWQQPVQVQFQSSSGKRKFAYFELDHLIPQAVGQSHIYSIEEIVGASLALIDFRISQSLPIGGYLSHLRFILERAASKVHKEQSLIDYDHFIRERAEIFGPSVMGYGDLEGINRYLGVGSLRSMSSATGNTGKHQAKSSNICWRFNSLGRCRQGCRFRHSCDVCGESHPRIECITASASQTGGRSQASAGANTTPQPSGIHH